MKPRFAFLLLLWGGGLDQSQAAIADGDFESGVLAPWVLTGAGAAVSNDVFTPAIGTPHGRFMGYITTLNNEGAKDFGFFDESPDIDANGMKESEYSSLSITFTTAAPSTVCAQLNFLTDELLPGNPWSVNDADVWGVATGNVRTGPFALLLAAATTSGSYTGTAHRLPPEAFSGGEIVESNPGVFPTIPDASRFQGQTGFSNHCFQIGPGVHTWTFFVADSRTDGVASAMLIDDFTVTPLPGLSETAVRHVVQISLDGLAAVHLRGYVTNAPEQFPTFVRLMNEGAFTMNARCDYDLSETVPNHCTMFTGRPVLQPAGLPNTTHHGYNNNFPGGETIHNSGNTNVPYKFSMFDVAHDYGRTTAFYAGKGRLTICDRSYDLVNGAPDVIGMDNGRDKIDFTSIVDGSGSAIVGQVDTILAELNSANPKEYIFIHIAEPDLTGHFSGWGSTAWSNMVRTVDTQLGRIVNAIDTNAALANQTALIVTADHGGGGVFSSTHTEAHHISNYTIPFFVRAPGIPGGTDLYQLFSNRADPGTNRIDYTVQPQPIRNGDGSNLALSLMDLPPIPGSFMVPTFAAITLRIARFNGQVAVFWADPNNQYDLEAAANLNATQWDTITTGISTNETTKVYTASAEIPGSKQFFRLRRR